MSMEEYMGYPFKQETQTRPEVPVPSVQIAETLFHVDLEQGLLRQADDPHNRIILSGVREESGFMHLFYDPKVRNHYTGDTSRPLDIPPHVLVVLVPPWKELDPVGLARRQGLADNYYTEQPAAGRNLKLHYFSREKTEQPQVKRSLKP